MTLKEWREAFCLTHPTIDAMKVAAAAVGIDPSRINWNQSAEAVAADVYEEANRRFSGVKLYDTVVALVGGVDPDAPNCACGKHRV
jgi:hypothetical protein